MKIRVSTDRMNISVDVWDKANELFSKITRMLVDYLHFDFTKEIEIEKPKLELDSLPKISNAVVPISYRRSIKNLLKRLITD